LRDLSRHLPPSNFSTAAFHLSSPLRFTRINLSINFDRLQNLPLHLQGYGVAHLRACAPFDASRALTPSSIFSSSSRAFDLFHILRPLPDPSISSRAFDLLESLRPLPEPSTSSRASCRHPELPAASRPCYTSRLFYTSSSRGGSPFRPCHRLQTMSPPPDRATTCSEPAPALTTQPQNPRR
jgi:hypothetical protein